MSKGPEDSGPVRPGEEPSDSGLAGTAGSVSPASSPTRPTSPASPIAPPAPARPDPWDALRRFTSARIALGRAGTSLPTQPQLAFALAHARARNAVHHELDFQALAQDLQPLGQVLRLNSAAADRATYLQRPDLGRRLDEASQAALAALPGTPAPELAFVIADGLSPLAIERHALPFLRTLLPAITGEWTLAPLSLVLNARVAVGDAIGEALGAALVVVLIGERPGLSSPDSMGIYLTWQPRSGLTDEARNCISNIRDQGLAYPVAAHKLRYLMNQARQRGLSGVRLKDESETLLPRQDSGAAGFLAESPSDQRDPG